MTKLFNQSISRYFIISVCTVILIIISFFVASFIYAHLTLSSYHRTEIESQVLKSKKEFIRNAVNRTIDIIELERAYCNKGHNNSQYCSEDQIKERLKDQIRETNLINNGYIWINQVLDYNGGDKYAIRLVHPNLRDTEGIYLSTSLEDPKGNTPYLAELEGVRDHGEVFFSYWFLKKDSDKLAPKLTFAKLYKDYDWIIATGVYLDDLEVILHSHEVESGKLLSRVIGFILVFGLFSLAIAFLGTMFFLRRIKSTIADRDQEIESREASLEKINRELEELVLKRTKVLEESRDLLRKSDERYDIAMDASQDGLYDWNLVSNEIYYSPGWKRMLGYEDHELKNDFSVWEQLTRKEDVTKAWIMQQELVSKNRDRFEMEFKMKHKDGHWLDILSRAKAIFDENGEAVRIIGTHVNISERKRSEERLKESEEMFRAVFEQAGGYCMILDPSTPDGIPLIIDANDAACSAHGYLREEFIGRPVADIDDEDGKRLVKERTAEIMTGKPFYVENIHVRKDGSFFPVAVNANRVDISDGRSLILTTEFDITERKKSEEELEWELRVNKALAELSNTLISPDYSIETISEKVYECAKKVSGSEHGYVSEVDRVSGDNIAHTLTSMMDEACTIKGPDQTVSFAMGDDGTYPRLWGHSLNTKESFFTNSPESHPSFSKLPQGHVAIDRFLSVPVLYNKEIIGQIALANAEADYNEKHIEAIERLAELYALAIHSKRAIEDNLQMANQLKQAQKMEAIGTLAGGIAHDFNNLLSVIIGFAEIAKDDFEDFPGDRESLDHILDASLRAKDLVKQILAFSRRSNTEKMILQPSSLIKESIKLIRPSIPTTIDVEYNIDAQVGLINADPSQINQIIINLCTNAYHSMEKTGGKLEVSLQEKFLAAHELENTREQQPGKYIALAVSDSGSGIDPEILDKVFDPFFTTKEVGKGTGMGLSIVHGLVKEHQGFVRIESIPGEGTCVTVFIPVCETNEVASDVHESGPVVGGTEKILLVDDEKILAQMTRVMLENLGYRVTVCNSSFEALQIFKRDTDHFDLIITDQTMPGMTGGKLAEKVLAIRQEIPIILCTGYSSIISEPEAKAIGIKEFVLKPVNKNVLARIIRQVLEK